MESTTKKMKKWAIFWLLCGGFVAGILSVCGLVSAVNWFGTEHFCSTFCHSMNGVAYAWKQGSHSRTASGKTAGCSDCHLYNASENALGPIGYISLLGHKVVAASHTAWGTVWGVFKTPTLWLEERPGVEAEEIQWFKETNFHTCRGCHDLSAMWDVKNPGIGAWHALYQNQYLDCLACHKDVGHNYKMVDAYIAKTGEYPDIASAWDWPVPATSGASPMPPKNMTPEQLQEAAKPWIPSATSGASKSKTNATSSASTAPAPAAAPAVNQSENTAAIAEQLYEKTKEPFQTAPAAAPAPQPAPQPAATSGASTKAPAPAAPTPAAQNQSADTAQIAEELYKETQNPLKEAAEPVRTAPAPQATTAATTSAAPDAAPVKEAVKEAAESAKDKVVKAVEPVKENVEKAAEAVKETVKEAAKETKETVEKAAEAVSDKVKAATAQATSAASAAKPQQ